MSLASSLKRVLTIVGATALALALALALVPALLPAESVRDAVVSELSRRLGVPVTIAGPVSVSVLPQLSVQLDGVTIGAGGEVLATADAAVGALRLFPLLAGKVSISDYALVRPRITVRVAADGGSNWDRALEAVRQLSGERAGGLPDFKIVQGAAVVIDEKTQQRVAIDDMEIAVSWPRFDRQANLSGRFSLRDEPVEISAVIGRPLALLTAEPTGLKMRLSAAPVKVGFEGQIAGRAQTMAAGTMTVETASLRALLRWLGQHPGVGSALGSFALKGEVRVTPTELSFSQANAELDGNLAEGALTVSFAGARPLVQGTLDADRVVATPYFSDMNPIPETDRGWNRRPIDLSALTSSDIDLRLSAREVVLGGATLGRSAASVTARNGRLTLSLGEAQAYGGSLRGALVLSPHADGVEVRATLNVQRAELGQGLAEWFGYRRLEGTGNAQISIEGHGPTMSDLARTASGQATLTAVDGAIRGFNAEAILRRLERRPLAATGVDARSGRTPYERMAATIRIVNGIASTEDIVLDGQIVRVRLEGSAQLQARELDLRGIATLKRSTGTPAAVDSNFELPFVVQGSWDDPFVLPDPQSLIRRSGAAAPLRDVNRDRDALRAVLDAINRQAGQEAAGEPMPPIPSFAPYPSLRPQN
ncbi:MAG: AsmA family protein [Phreatobacter sp.]